MDNPVESIPITFGQGFGGITDIQVGPHGYMYILNYTGDLYKILPTSQSTISKAQSPLSQSSIVPEGSILVTINGISGVNSYAPNPLTINPGDTITWYNADTISHTATSGSDGDPDEGQLFDSDAILSKQAFTLKFDNNGTFDYYCLYHPSMVGEIIVK